MNEDDILNYPYNNYLKVRLELVLLRDDELQAKIMRIVEVWMVHQRKQWHLEVAQAAADNNPEPPEPEHYWVTLSHAQIIAQLYLFDSSKAAEGKKNTISKGTLRKAINALIDDHYLLTRAQPDNEFGAPQYTINRPLVQAHMQLLPKSPWRYLGHNGNVLLDPPTNFEYPPHLQILNIPPLSNFSGGDIQNLELPLTNLEDGELQKLKILIDSVIESKKDHDNNLNNMSDTSPNDENELNTVPDGGNRSFSFQEATFSHQDTDSQPLNNKIEAFIQEVDKRLPAENETPENEAQAQTGALPPSKEETMPASYSPRQATNKEPASPIPITTGARSKKEAAQLLTLQGSHVIELYEAFKKRKITRNSANVKAANGLGDVVESDQDFNEVLTLIANDKFLKEHKVRIDLDFVYRKYDGFLDRVDRLREEAERRSSGKPSQGNTNPPVHQEPTAEKVAKIDAIQERLAKMQQPKQAVI